MRDNPAWADKALTCCNRVDPGVERRPGNALNIEIGSAMPRCLFRAPDGRGLAWLLSGGSVLSYGACSRAKCERIESGEWPENNQQP